MARLEFKTFFEHLDDDVAVTQAPGDQSTWRWNSPVAVELRTGGMRMSGSRLSADHVSPSVESSGRARAQIGIIGDFERSATRSLAQVSFSVGLNTERYAPEQKLLVRRFGCLSKQLAVLVPELGHGRRLQRVDRR